MPKVVIEGGSATCGHKHTGSPNVVIGPEAKGAVRVGVDTAGGTITGPGVPTVTVNNAPIAIFGDAIEGHGSGEHASPTTSDPYPTVIAGPE